MFHLQRPLAVILTAIEKNCFELTAIFYKTISVLLSDEYILPPGYLSCNDYAIAAGGLGFVPLAG